MEISQRPKKYRLQEQPKSVCLHYFPGYLRQRTGPKQRASATPVIYTFWSPPIFPPPTVHNLGLGQVWEWSADGRTQTDTSYFRDV